MTDSRTSAAGLLRVSVVLSTRDRTESAGACVDSILTNSGFEELVIVDQSGDDSTERALGDIKDRRLHYLRSATRGVTASRNLGVAAAGGDVLVFTDDDCRVAEDWIDAISEIFRGDPEVAVVCGRVRVADDVSGRGFTESFEPRVRHWQGRFPPFGQDWGITANMALRRAAFERVGGFDPLLGAGSQLRSGGEPDLLFRLLRAGYKVVNASEVLVDHYGVRQPGEQSQRLIRGYGLGSGAALFKHVRAGDLQAVRLYGRFVGTTVGRAAANLVRTGRPSGLGFLAAFLWGAVASFRYRVDRRTRRFARRRVWQWPLKTS